MLFRSIEGSRKINELGDPSGAQPVAFKATEEKKEESTPSRQPIDASKLDNEEMALVIKSFRQILKQRRGKDYKSRSKKVCYKCGKPGHFIAKCPLSSDSDRGQHSTSPFLSTIEIFRLSVISFLCCLSYCNNHGFFL